MADRRVPGLPGTFVSPSEVMAAQMMVRRMRARGEEPSSALLAIANARGALAQSVAGPGDAAWRPTARAAPDTHHVLVDRGPVRASRDDSSGLLARFVLQVPGHPDAVVIYPASRQSDVVPADLSAEADALRRVGLVEGFRVARHLEDRGDESRACALDLALALAGVNDLTTARQRLAGSLQWLEATLDRLADRAWPVAAVNMVTATAREVAELLPDQAVAAALLRRVSTLEDGGSLPWEAELPDNRRQVPIRAPAADIAQAQQAVADAWLAIRRAYVWQLCTGERSSPQYDDWAARAMTAARDVGGVFDESGELEKLESYVSAMGLRSDRPLLAEVVSLLGIE